MRSQSRRVAVIAVMTPPSPGPWRVLWVDSCEGSDRDRAVPVRAARMSGPLLDLVGSLGCGVVGQYVRGGIDVSMHLDQVGEHGRF